MQWTCRRPFSPEEAGPDPVTQEAGGYQFVKRVMTLHVSIVLSADVPPIDLNDKLFLINSKK
jgi:hypothetical protein